MSLRTYSLITHPLYLRYIERSLYGEAGLPSSEFPAPPRIDKIQDIAEYLKISPYTIRHLLLYPKRNYRRFPLKKRGGGERIISAPRLFLKVVQWWIKDTILDVMPVDSSCHGFVRGRSFVTNAKSHLGAQHVLNVDIKNCFDSTSATLVEKIFQKIGYSDAVSLQLAAICSLDQVLPQGAPTSPMLLNQVLTNFDRELRLFCEGMGITYTRYADDMTFSSPDRIDEMLVADIGERLASVGLQLNAKKTRFMGLNEQKIVTGLVLGAGRVNLPAPYLNSVRGWIGRLERLPELSKADAEKLRGTLCMIREVGGNRSGDLCARGFRLLG